MADHAFPSLRFESLLFRVYGLLGLKRKFRAFGARSFVSPYSIVQGAEHISIGERVHISRRTRLLAIANYSGRAYRPDIVIANGTYIGENCVISANGPLHIGNDVTFGDNVYLGSAQHEYQDVSMGVLQQGLTTARIEIGDCAWIGYGAFITGKGEITIGEHSVISANSVVTKNVPAFTVVAGNPAVPIKQYDPEQRVWVGLHRPRG